MERRDFLALGAASTSLLTACAPSRGASGAAPSARGAGSPLVRLSSNENPLGLSPAARRALLENLGEANRYPRQARADLIEALAAKHAVSPEHIQLGCGSAEVLQMAVQATPDGASVVMADPTFEDVGKFAVASGRRVIPVRVREDGSHDIPRMRAAAGTGPSLVFVCNPNNPTGTLTSCDEVDAWIDSASERTVFAIDEAYFEFVEDSRYRSALPWIVTKPNVIVVRTFSKIYGMAGMRLGYGIAQPATMLRLRAFALANNANQLAAAAGRAALGDTDFQARTLASNRAARTILTGTLDALGLAWLPSHTNFLMHRIPGEVATYNARMMDAGFRVGRPFPPMLDHSRVSIGTPDEMRQFAAMLRTFRTRGWV